MFNVAPLFAHSLSRAVASTLLVAVAWLCGGAPAADAQRQQRAVVPPAAALGAHAMIYLDAPPSFKLAMMRQAAALGASLVRVDVPLALVHPDPAGGPDYSAFDDDLAIARQTGRQLVGILGATPWWAAACPEGVPPTATAACPYGDLALYAAHVTELVRRGRGTVAAWEVMNEPQGPTFLGSPEQYAQLLDTAISAIRAGDPAAKVVIGGPPNHPISRTFLTRVLQTPGLDLAQRIDVANVHVRGPVMSLPHQVRMWRRFMLELGVDKPLWVTEFGYPSNSRAQTDAVFGGPVEARRFGFGEGGQAAYLRRGVPALLRGGAEKVFVTLRDGQPGLFETEGLLHGPGVADPPGVDPRIGRKPGFRAVRRLVASGALEPAAIAASVLARAAARARRGAGPR